MVHQIFTGKQRYTQIPDLFIHVVLNQVLKKSLSNADTYRKLKKKQKKKPKYTICASYVQRFLIREIALLLKTNCSFLHSPKILNTSTL